MKLKYESAYIVKKLNAGNSRVVVKMAKTIARVLKRFKVPVIENRDETTDKTLYIAIGGDGTMLYACRKAARRNADTIGFNLGNLGFLTDFSPENVSGVLSDVLFHDGIKIEERTLLRIENTDGQPHFAMNDIVISNLYSDTMIDYELIIKDSSGFENHAGWHTANGVIISTPTGSTAYALNAGGSLLSPDLDVIEILPICATTMTTRPLIISGESEVIIKIKNHKDNESPIMVKIDGQSVENEAFGPVFNMHSAKSKSRIVHAEDWNFYEVLTSKLGWSLRH